MEEKDQKTVIEESEPEKEKEDKAPVEAEIRDIPGGGLIEGYDLDKKEEAADRIRNEYQNCIVLQGEFCNTVLNKGTISGGISQQASLGKYKEGEQFDFSKNEDIDRFVKEFTDRKELLDFLCILFLELVPVSLLADVREAMKDILFAKRSEKQYDLFSSAEREMDLLHLQKILAVRNGIFGKDTIECFVFQDSVSTDEIGRTIWETYRELRGPVLLWLLELKNIKRVADVLFYQIANAFTRIVKYDFLYARTEVFLRLRQSGGYEDRTILVRALKEYMDEKGYDEYLDQTILEGYKRNDSFLWQTGYRLYREDGAYSFQRKTEEILLLKLRKDMEDFRLNDDRRNSWHNDNIDFYPAYHDRNIERLFMKAIFALYKECQMEQEKTRFGYYFCWLFREDFSKEGFPKYQLMMTHCLKEKETRRRVREMYIELWRKSRFRRLLGYILYQHFIELERKGRSWSYMQDFFKTIAFTGDRADFEDTVRFLERYGAREQGGNTADEIKSWLYGLLQMKKTGRNT